MSVLRCFKLHWWGFLALHGLPEEVGVTSWGVCVQSNEVLCLKSWVWGYRTTTKVKIFQKSCSKKNLYQLRILSHHMDSVLNQARGFPLPWKTLLVFVFTTHLPWNAQRKCFCRFSFHINVSSLADGAEAIYCNVSNYTTDFIHEKLMKGETDSFVWSTHESTERNPTW